MSCATCPHFKHSEKHTVGKMFAYGCSASMNGLTFWTNTESYFSKYGCPLNGDVEDKSKQMDIFDFMEV